MRTGVLVVAWNIPCSFNSFFLHNEDINCYFGSLLVDSRRFQLTNTTSTTFLLVELVAIKHGHHARLEKIHVTPNISGVVAQLRREFRRNCAELTSLTSLAPNSAHSTDRRKT